MATKKRGCIGGGSVPDEPSNLGVGCSQRRKQQMEMKETEISQLVKILEILFPQDG
jgi:hypothetical protein